LLDALEDITRTANKIGSYAFLRFAADTEDPEAQAMVARVRQWSAELQNRLLFFELWWKNLPDEQARALLDVAGDRRYYLEKMRLFRPYTLDEQAEQIINYKNAAGIRFTRRSLRTGTTRTCAFEDMNAPSRPGTWPTTCPMRWWIRCWTCAVATRRCSSAISGSRPGPWRCPNCGGTTSTRPWARPIRPTTSERPSKSFWRPLNASTL